MSRDSRIQTPRNRRRKRRHFGLLAGCLAGMAVLIALTRPALDRWHALGPMTQGHESLRCETCHKPAPGTARQQLQALVRHGLGWRGTPADFGSRDVGNEICLECHDRPNDRHPVFRFSEPRFAKARASLAPQFCVSCHLEHRGRRVTLETTAYCEVCHRETRLNKDPLDIPHRDLIAEKRWSTCLGCHDFHGNHVMKTPLRVVELIAEDKIKAYFAGGLSPYSERKKYPAKKEKNL